MVLCRCTLLAYCCSELPRPFDPAAGVNEDVLVKQKCIRYVAYLHTRRSYPAADRQEAAFGRCGKILNVVPRWNTAKDTPAQFVVMKSALATLHT